MAEATWRRIGRLSYRRRIALVAASSTPVTMFLFLEAVQVSNILVDAPPLARIAVGVALGSALELLVLAVAALLYAGLLVTADGATVRIGRSRFRAEELDRVQLDVSGKRDVLSIRVGRHGGPVARLWLRGPSGALLAEDERELLLSTLDQSMIRPARSIYDPHDRFTHTNFPGSLTKEEAMDLVEHLDDAAYPLPLSG